MLKNILILSLLIPVTSYARDLRDYDGDTYQIQIDEIRVSTGGSSGVTMAQIKAEPDIADSLTKKHSNANDHDPATEIAAREAADQSKVDKSVFSSSMTTLQDMIAASGGEQDTVYRLVADTTTQGTNFAPSSLVAPLLANKDYLFEAYVLFRTTTTTTGANFSINLPANPTSMTYTFRIPTSATANVSSFRRAVNTGTTGTAVDVINVNCLAVGNGIIQNGANAGNLVITFCSELALTPRVTIKAGSIIRLRLLN